MSDSPLNQIVKTMLANSAIQKEEIAAPAQINQEETVATADSSPKPARVSGIHRDFHQDSQQVDSTTLLLEPFPQAMNTMQLDLELDASAESSRDIGESRIKRWLAAISRGFQNFTNDLLDLSLPPSCLVCKESLGDSTHFICQDCLPKLNLVQHGCLRCGSPLPKVVPETDGCIRCHGKHWSFQRAIAVGPYHGLLKNMVIAMKKPRFETTTIYFGKLLAKRLVQTELVNEIDLIIPVPSHWWRRMTRRISTAEILAETVACELELPWSRNYAWRSRYTSKQGMLKAAERGANVKGAFKAKFPCKMLNQRILLVDDVLTSGATANEVTKALLDAGAQSVMVGAIARALGDQKSRLVNSGALRDP